MTKYSRVSTSRRNSDKAVDSEFKNLNVIKVAKIERLRHVGHMIRRTRVSTQRIQAENRVKNKLSEGCNKKFSCYDKLHSSVLVVLAF